MTSESLTRETIIPRQCHLQKRTDFDGYGFNLHADKTRTGQFVGKVDPGSPAEAAGLREGDRIVEVNGVNIANENHRQVVERIKAIDHETRLLVLDLDADLWCREHGVVVKGTDPDVQVISSSKSIPVEEEEVAPVKTFQVEEVKVTESEPEYGRSEVAVDVPDSLVAASQNNNHSLKNANNNSRTSFDEEPGLDVACLNMSVAEVRQLLAQKKKYDPKKIQMDLKQKYDIISSM